MPAQFAQAAPASDVATTTTATRSRSSTASSLSSGASSPASSLRSRRSSNLTLDLASLPPLPTPSTAPTNTLLLTNLDHADIFRPDNLETIRDLVAQSAPQGLHSWAPLRSFRRIVASFYSAEDAARVRAVWEGESILGCPCHVYYGRPTPLDVHDPAKNSLALPDAGKLFFISPPPSPPHGWEMRLEGAPNKQVHADDLADALAKLHHQAATADEYDADVDMPMPSPASDTAPGPAGPGTRSRSATLVIYQPAAHSSHPHLPAIAVEDMTDASTDHELNSATWASAAERPIKAHTARPPVELMNDA